MEESGVTHGQDKIAATLRIDADVVLWFTTKYGKDWEQEINYVLRRHMRRRSATSVEIIKDTTRRFAPALRRLRDK